MAGEPLLARSAQGTAHAERRWLPAVEQRVDARFVAHLQGQRQLHRVSHSPCGQPAARRTPHDDPGTGSTGPPPLRHLGAGSSGTQP